MIPVFGKTLPSIGVNLYEQKYQQREECKQIRKKEKSNICKPKLETRCTRKNNDKIDFINEDLAREWDEGQDADTVGVQDNFTSRGSSETIPKQLNEEKNATEYVSETSEALQNGISTLKLPSPSSPSSLLIHSPLSPGGSCRSPLFSESSRRSLGRMRNDTEREKAREMKQLETLKISNQVKESMDNNNLKTEMKIKKFLFLIDENEKNFMAKVKKQIQTEDTNNYILQKQLYDQWEREVYIPIQRHATKHKQKSFNNFAEKYGEWKKKKVHQSFSQMEEQKEHSAPFSISKVNHNDPFLVNYKQQTEEEEFKYYASLPSLEHAQLFSPTRLASLSSAVCSFPSAVPHSREKLSATLWDKIESTPHGRYTTIDPKTNALIQHLRMKPLRSFESVEESITKMGMNHFSEGEIIPSKGGKRIPEMQKVRRPYNILNGQKNDS